MKKSELTLLPTPKTILFDWHGTLVDTQDAMTSAMEEMLDQLEELSLVERLIPEAECRNQDDVANHGSKSRMSWLSEG